MIVTTNAGFQADEHNSVSGIKREMLQNYTDGFQEVVKS